MLTCENSRLSLLLATSDAARVVYASGIWSGALIGRRCSYIVLAIVYERQTNVKCKCNEFTTKKSIFVDYILLYKTHLSYTKIYHNGQGET